MRPPRARREKPCISAFTGADILKIPARAPDLVLAYSDLQVDIVAALGAGSRAEGLASGYVERRAREAG